MIKHRPDRGESVDAVLSLAAQQVLVPEAASDNELNDEMVSGNPISSHF